MAGQYGQNNAQPASGATENHEHGYEWEQAREEERRAREEAQASETVSPPGYNVASGEFWEQCGDVKLIYSGNQGFAPPPGAPPGKQQHAAV
jgi:hypothetical protein